MKPTPPFLVGAAVLFWGWQTGLLVEGGLMALVIESARFVKVRWEFSEEDSIRIWNFCSLLVLAAAVYAFSMSGATENFRGLLRNPSLANQTSAGRATTLAAVSLLRWLPITMFLFVAARSYSAQEEVPLTTLSLFLRRRRLKAMALGEALPPVRSVNVSLPFFAVCLFSASAHGGQDITFFWGFSALVLWALWPRRSARFGAPAWIAAAAVTLGGGYLGQSGIRHLQWIIESYNPGWLSGPARRGFDPKQNRTEIGEIGRIKNSGSIQIRLEVPNGGAPPAYLREASYRTYKTGVWYSGPAKDEFQPLAPASDLTTWVRRPGGTNRAAVKIACYLEGGKGLLPLPPDAARLENLPADTLQTNHMGAVFAEGPGLVIFDARYGSGRGIDSPANTNEDLEVNPREWAALDQVITEMHLATNAPAPEAMRAINGLFQTKFNYSLWQDAPKPGGTNETPLGRFLLKTRSGHCEYFATATVLLLRRLNLPARYALGWSVHEGTGNKYVVRQRDAHAWCLIWDGTENMWKNFDTTPASWLVAEHERASAWQTLWDLWSRAVFEFSKLRWGQTNLRQYLLWIFVPVLALLLFQILFRSGRRRHQGMAAGSETNANWPGLDSEYYQLEAELARRGFARQPGEAPAAWRQRLALEPTLAPMGEPMKSLMRLHYRYRFDPSGLEETDRKTLRAAAKNCLERIGKT